MTNILYLGIAIAIFAIIKYFVDKNNEEDDIITVEPEEIAKEEPEETHLSPLTTMENNNNPLSLKDRITTLLRRLGFQVEVSEDDVRFSYEGINMLIMLTDDENYFSILVPGILDVEDYGEIKVLRIAESINKQLKYIKAFLPHNSSLWLSYERQLHRNENIEDALVETMIQNLAHAFSSVGYFLNNSDSNNNSNG